MASFRLGQALNNKQASQDYGFLVDSLTVLENSLASDGKLSPADLNLLKQKAAQVYTYPGLTPVQRSNIEVKISGYEKETALFNLKKTNDLSVMNDNVKNDLSTVAMAAGNNPLAFMSLKRQVLENKVNQLSVIVEQQQSAGVEGDVTGYLNELSATNAELQDVTQAINDMETYAQAPSGKPNSDFVAYVSTNSKGEITDIKVEREGSKTGYYETNGLYGGLKIYGKANRKEGENAVFRLGGEEFKGAASGSFFTTEGGTFQNLPKLISTKTTQGKSFGIVPEGETYVDVSPDTVSTQQYIPDGGWARGASGKVYQRTGDGYVQHDPTEDLNQYGIKDNEVITIPKVWEDSLRNSVIENSTPLPDLNLPMTAPATSTAPTSVPATTTPSAATTTPISSRPATSSPTIRAPQTASGQAVSLLGQAKGFLANLFGR